MLPSAVGLAIGAALLPAFANAQLSQAAPGIGEYLQCSLIDNFNTIFERVIDDINITPIGCQVFCISTLKRSYAAVYGDACYCTKDPMPAEPSITILPETLCNTPCLNGGLDARCGGLAFGAKFLVIIYKQQQQQQLFVVNKQQYEQKQFLIVCKQQQQQSQQQQFVVIGEQY
ncbi:hypothetical protein EsH8_I_000361 [Colletotrichum jinshuiense]